MSHKYSVSFERTAHYKNGGNFEIVRAHSGEIRTHYYGSLNYLFDQKPDGTSIAKYCGIHCTMDEWLAGVPDKSAYFIVISK